MPSKAFDLAEMCMWVDRCARQDYVHWAPGAVGRMRVMLVEIDRLQQDCSLHDYYRERIQFLERRVEMLTKPEPLHAALYGVEVGLACGHTKRFNAASSTFDFPEDPVWCYECEAERHLHPEVVAAIHAQWKEEEGDGG